VIDRSLRFWDESLLWRRLISWPLYISTGLLAAAGIGIAVYGATLSMNWLLIVLPLSLVLISGSLGVYYLFHRGKRMNAILTIVLTIVVSVSYGVGPVVSQKNANKSAKPFCLKVRRYLPPGKNLKMYGFNRPIYAVYTERFMDVAWDTHTLAKWFKAEEPVYVVAKEKAYLKIKDTLALPIYVVIREWIDHRYVLLLSNRPAPEVPPASGKKLQ
jgi:hypothetical protein